MAHTRVESEARPCGVLHINLRASASCSTSAMHAPLCRRERRHSAVMIGHVFGRQRDAASQGAQGAIELRLGADSTSLDVPAPQQALKNDAERTGLLSADSDCWRDHQRLVCAQTGFVHFSGRQTNHCGPHPDFAAAGHSSRGLTATSSRATPRSRRSSMLDGRARRKKPRTTRKWRTESWRDQVKSPWYCGRRCQRWVSSSFSVAFTAWGRSST